MYLCCANQLLHIIAQCNSEELKICLIASFIVSSTQIIRQRSSQYLHFQSALVNTLKLFMVIVTGIRTAVRPADIMSEFLCNTDVFAPRYYTSLREAGI